MDNWDWAIADRGPLRTAPDRWKRCKAGINKGDDEELACMQTRDIGLAIFCPEKNRCEFYKSQSNKANTPDPKEKTCPKS